VNSSAFFASGAFRRSVQAFGNPADHPEQERHLLLGEQVDLQVQMITLLGLPCHPVLRD